MQGNIRAKLLHQPQRLQPGELRHVDVDQHEMDLLAANDFQRLFAIAGEERAEPPRLEDDLQCLAEVRVVVGDQQGWRVDPHR